jgi:4-hydroxy-tetrahydrodipicolinate synthase
MNCHPELDSGSRGVCLDSCFRRNDRERKYMNNITFFGSIPAIITPFKKNGDLDVPALRKFVEFQIEGEIDAIVPCGSTGEAATLSEDEYQTVIETVVKEVNGKIPVIAGAGSNDTQKAIRLSNIAKEAGANALLHVTPFYNKPTPNGLVAHFKAIAEVGLPIVIYNVPGRTGSNVSPATIVRIAREVPLVKAVKEASGSIIQMMEIIKLVNTEGPKDFAVLSGDDAFTLPLIAAGGHGCISVVCNEVPQQFSDMVHAALAGDWNKAKSLHYQLWDLMNVNFIESNPIPVKTALSLMGKIELGLRLPLVPLEEKSEEALKKVLKDLKII